MCSTEEERLLLHDKIMEVSFDGQSGMVHFKPTVGDRLPVKMEVVNFRVGFKENIHFYKIFHKFS